MKKIRIPAVCLAALLLLAGCGKEDGVSTTASAPAASQTVQTTTIAETTKPAEVTAPPVKETIYKDGSYEGIGYGNNGSIQVKIVIADDKIVQLECVSHNDTPDYFGRAWDHIYAAVMGQESPDLSEVDGVSGASNSSRGIIDAIKAALYKARR